MLLLRSAELLDDDDWYRELKLDGYRAIAFKSGGELLLRSRNDKDFGARYPEVFKVLSCLPNDTLIDGEIVAIDESGRPSFSALQDYGSSKIPIFF